MKTAWTLEARIDRSEIYTRIEDDDPVAALNMDELFEKRAADLIKHSMLGRAGRVSGTRELVVHPNYILIYDIAGDTIRILRVLHAAQHWPSKKH
ncbi:type II toxin-antitoxin system mRNA interferase toxin, RelE/StbE family [Asticcacaulis benevestitus]|uniref:Translation repressor RelE n=1 Tax=Asticcacaulis benevestitus DSM 16100 = ATCC BAA-896 TaxID=1121022 RepID=V4P4R1_9CAUL|nr:type II toxin-antitoxin system mRNA interferase toxin, RelE/StbE family [Asticcacaulis benevestitus]ESQ80285.1 hypothetical protein ABENE_22440 [Asticcacaulis benevestitus DSM 16100 = ATCC BAA-896]